MKTIILNGGPRKNWNTAQLLNEAGKGAESVGDSVEYFDLYDLDFSGCRSCLACKRAGIEKPCKCYIKDGLTPVLESVWQADRLIAGSPIYFGEPTGMFRAFLERIIFPALSYNDFNAGTFKGKVDVDVFLTMNAPQEIYAQMYEQKMKEYFAPFGLLKGKVRIIPVFDTLQVKDYSKYEMKKFSEEHKRKVHEKEFPAALAQAFEIGAGRAVKK